MKKEILLYKWGEGRGQGRIGASFVARGRTLNTVTVLVTALFFFSYSTIPDSIPARISLLSRLSQPRPISHPFTFTA